MRSEILVASLLILLFSSGCGSQDIPPAHKGRMFEKTGAAAFYSGGSGFSGPILSPGTHYTGLYNEVRMLDCSTRTYKEPMTSMTRDGVQFALDVYITCGANCEDDKAVTVLLDKLAPIGATAAPAPAPAAGAGNATPDERDPVETDGDRAVTSRQVYNTYIRPALGEAVRQAVSAYDANDLNSHREELFGKIKKKLDQDLTPSDPKTAPALVTVVNFNLSNFKLPEEMANAAADRATQQVLRDKSVAEQDRIKVETETVKLTVAQKKAEGEAEAAKIDAVGAALHRNPEYYVRDVYYYAAEKGGSIVLPADPHVLLTMTPKR
jgi:hypothetical protein